VKYGVDVAVVVLFFHCYLLYIYNTKSVIESLFIFFYLDAHCKTTTCYINDTYTHYYAYKTRILITMLTRHVFNYSHKTRV